MRSAILTYCAHFGIKDLAPFTKSWKSKTNSDLFVFPTNMEKHVTQHLSSEGVNFVDIESYWSYGYNQLSLRFFMWRDFVRDHVQDYEYILLTDCRDVIFQSDPFVYLKGMAQQGVYWAIEDKTIRSDRIYNSQWIIDLFGQKIFEQIADRPAVCAGTTLGPSKAILCYLEEMCHLLQVVEFKRLEGGYDQGFHNYIANYLRPSYAYLDTNFNLYGTVGTIPATRLSLSRIREILIDGTCPPIIHQYDRHDFITQQIMEDFCGDGRT